MLTERLVAGLTALPGVRLFTPAQAASRVALVSFQVEGWRPLDLARALERDFAILVGAGLYGASEACRSIGAYPCGTVRLSPGWSTSEEEIDRAIAAVATLARVP
jgi:cysteine desulfurase/selenocysteine lyase